MNAPDERPDTLVWLLSTFRCGSGDAACAAIAPHAAALNNARVRTTRLARVRMPTTTDLVMGLSPVAASGGPVCPSPPSDRTTCLARSSRTVAMAQAACHAAQRLDGVRMAREWRACATFRATFVRTADKLRP